jgi:hypothetical protein
MTAVFPVRLALTPAELDHLTTGFLHVVGRSSGRQG